MSQGYFCCFCGEKSYHSDYKHKPKCPSCEKQEFMFVSPDEEIRKWKNLKNLHIPVDTKNLNIR